MKVYRILLAVGKDRPGIVGNVSTFLLKYDSVYSVMPTATSNIV